MASAASFAAMVRFLVRLSKRPKDLLERSARELEFLEGGEDVDGGGFGEG